VPRYELEIIDPDGGDPARQTLETDESYGVGDSFDFNDSTLTVAEVDEPDDDSFDEKLVCNFQGARPHYF